MEFKYLTCKCGDFMHTVRFTLDTEDGELWIETHMNHELPWYMRAWVALRYVLAMPTKYGHFDVSMIEPKDVGDLRDMLDCAEALQSKTMASRTLRQTQEKHVTTNEVL